MDSLSGKVKIYDEEYSFLFENNVLKVNIPIENKRFKPLTRGKLDCNVLVGTIENDSKFITFFIGDNSYSTGFVARYFVFTSVQISVKFYIIHGRPLNSYNFTQIKLNLVNDKFRKWFGFSLGHNFNKRLSRDKKVIDLVKYNISSSKEISSFKLDGISFEMRPSYFIEGDISSKFVTILSIRYLSRKINFEVFDTLFTALQKFLKFVFFRQNVEFGEIDLLLRHKIGNKYLFEKAGKIYIPIKNTYEMENSDMSKLNDIGFIPWSLIYKKTGYVFKLIENNELYLFSLPNCKRDQQYISIGSASLIASSLEAEYSKLPMIDLFNDIEDRNDIKNILLDNIDLFGTEPKKDLVRKNIGFLFSPSLKMKTKRCLNDFSFAIKPIADKLGYKNYITEISNEFVLARNAIDHGNKKWTMTSKTANAFYIIRIIVFCIQLRDIGYDDNEIKIIIKDVFELFSFFD